MRQVEIFRYFAFGFDYGTLQNGLLAHKKESALNFLDQFFETLRELDLEVTLGVAQQLFAITESIRSAEDEKVSAEVAGKIKTEVQKLDPALDAELKLRNAYVLTKKRYPLKSLLTDPTALLGAGVSGSLTATATRDFGLACTQVALSQPTAAAFHLMRTLEEQVRVLYHAFKKTKRLENPMWGPMIDQLRQKKAPKPSLKLLDHLDGMRVHFRNPTQHPNTFYSMDEAQDLLNQTITAVNMVAAELPK